MLRNDWTRMFQRVLNNTIISGGITFEKDPHVEWGEIALAMELCNLLRKHYPGYAWAVNVDSRPTVGVVNILNFDLSGNIGYTLHLKNVYSDICRKNVVMAGGTILEAARMRQKLPVEDPGYANWDPQALKDIGIWK